PLLAVRLAAVTIVAADVPGPPAARPQHRWEANPHDPGALTGGVKSGSPAGYTARRGDQPALLGSGVEGAGTPLPPPVLTPRRVRRPPPVQPRLMQPGWRATGRRRPTSPAAPDATR